MQYCYPSEHERHHATWLSFCANHAVWQDLRITAAIQANISRLALNIARFEPVKILVRPEEMVQAKNLMGSDVEYIEAALDDIWLRDSGAVFVKNSHSGEKSAVNFNFNGWGNKQAHRQDAHAPAIMAEAAGVPLVRADICLEGGALEVDGRGNAILNESCILNDNRNPGMSKAECEKALARFLGIEHIIWLPGMKDADITDSHIDFYAKYIDGQTVLINREHNRAKPDHIITRQTAAALAEHFELNEANILDNPQSVRVDTDEFPDFAASYINYYACNGGVIVPEFGDAHTDAAAKEKLQLWYPDREIVAMNIDWIAIGGGGIHCVTQQEFA